MTLGEVTARRAVALSGHWYTRTERSAAQFLASRRAASIAWSSGFCVVT